MKHYNLKHGISIKVGGGNLDGGGMLQVCNAWNLEPPALGAIYAQMIFHIANTGGQEKDFINSQVTQAESLK